MTGVSNISNGLRTKICNMHDAGVSFDAIVSFVLNRSMKATRDDVAQVLQSYRWKKFKGKRA